MPNDPFYTTAAWRQFRAATLKQWPFCQVAGCTSPSSHVDHVISRRRGGGDFDPANVRALCQSHHNANTARRDHPDRRASTEPLRAKGCDAAGRPLDPRHPWNVGKA